MTPPLAEHGLLFSASMIRALLAGTKTQTRRMVWLGSSVLVDLGLAHPGELIVDEALGSYTMRDRKLRWHERTLAETLALAPNGPVGRIVYAKETWHNCPHCERTYVAYRAGGWMRAPSGAPDDGGDRDDFDDRGLRPQCAAHGWRPSIHMPKWAARLWFRVTRVRLERVQAITEEDARAEGFVDDREDPREVGYPREGSFVLQNYRELWDTINGAGSWASNPWVWAYDLERITR